MATWEYVLVSVLLSVLKVGPGRQVVIVLQLIECWLGQWGIWWSLLDLVWDYPLLFYYCCLIG